MFVVLISFPPIKAGKDAEFSEWFASQTKSSPTIRVLSGGGF